ncbi:MAG: hypothetical protein SH850_14220 [Planctomycetaceae bacterium]|nr:hypothetical protein [Planctomycetaceae bacterium]
MSGLLDDDARNHEIFGVAGQFHCTEFQPKICPRLIGERDVVLVTLRSISSFGAVIVSSVIVSSMVIMARFAFSRSFFGREQREPTIASGDGRSGDQSREDGEHSDGQQWFGQTHDRDSLTSFRKCGLRPRAGAKGLLAAPSATRRNE